MIRCIIAVQLALGCASLAAAQESDRPPVVTWNPGPQESPKPVVKPVTQEPRKQEPGRQDPVKPAPVKPAPVTPEPVKPNPAKPEPGKPIESPKPGDDITEIELPEDMPLPPGASPEDLRAMRSSQEMLEAERRLMQRIKKGELKGVDKLLTFEEIASWPYQDGLKGCPEAVKKLDGKQVMMIGFMLPIDEVENIKEFLLVQSLWACCYGTPPDINGIVRVVMKGDARCDYQFDPIMTVGTLRVRETREDGYCIDIYQVEAESVTLIK